MNLLLTDNNTKGLQSPRIRATDAQKATMKIGSHIPIATGSYQTGASTALVSSLRLRSYGLTVNDAVNAMRTQNPNCPAAPSPRERAS